MKLRNGNSILDWNAIFFAFISSLSISFSAAYKILFFYMRVDNRRISINTLSIKNGETFVWLYF